MNKYEEALDYLRWIGSDGYYKKKREKSFDILQELVDNATPKKAAIQEIGQYIIRYVGKCECGEFLARIHVYCPGCGQRLDWSNEE